MWNLHSFLSLYFSTPSRAKWYKDLSCSHHVELLAAGESPSVLCRNISTSQHSHAGSRWRDRTCKVSKTEENASQGESQSGRDYGPLVDLPDWAYVDGRPAPPGSGQLRRKQEQRQIAERIDRLAAEMMAAVQKEKDAVKAEQQKQHEINQRKLKPKGQAFSKRTYRNVDTV